MDFNVVLAVFITLLISIPVSYFMTKRKLEKQLEDYKSFLDAISHKEGELEILEEKIKEAEKSHSSLDRETKSLQSLKSNANKLNQQVRHNMGQLKSIKTEISHKSEQISKLDSEVNELMSKVDLYSRLEEFVDIGHYEMPDYLYETSTRFTEEIKRVRDKQKTLIKEKNAVIYPETTTITSDKSYNKKILDGQVKLILTAFNIDCDELIGKVNPGNFTRTLERIEILANTLEKSAATLHCGFNLKYIEMKYNECRLQYQFTLKRQEEREEEKARKELSEASEIDRT